MPKYNVFLCYRGERAALLAGTIYSELSGVNNKSLHIFFAPRCIPFGADFVKECRRVAGEVTLMILLITADFFDGVGNPEDVVGEELRCALKNPSCKFLPVLFSDLNMPDLAPERFFSEEEVHRFSHINPIRYTDVYSFESSALLMPIFEHLAIRPDQRAQERPARTRTHITENNKGGFFSDNNRTERIRLMQQQRLLLDYDMPVYEKLLAGKSGLNVLDLGSGNGVALMKRLGERKEVARIIGTEFDPTNVEHANDAFRSDRCAFYQCDVEAEDFLEHMEEIMEEQQIEGFDFINILALISHLRNPSKLLRNVKKLCNPGAVLIVRNIDDGLNIAYPDEDGEFANALSKLQMCASCGYRFSGRQLYYILKSRGFRDIVLEKTAINTVGMTVEEKEALFDVVFKFIGQGLKRELANNPDSDVIRAAHDWFFSKLDGLEERFMMQEFFLNFGFMLYTARV